MREKEKGRQREEDELCKSLFFNWTGILSQICVCANSHTLTHTFSFKPTCVLLSFPDLFGESAGTSEALRECLESKKQRHYCMLLGCSF